ncbi:MAG: DUF368 domain-containing protein [Nanobdellota archaeon]
MLKIFLKGLLMGACDIIPGISGGTIAFITGIYERLIRAVKDVLKFRFRDLGFLVTLFAGIAISILALSGLIERLLEGYFAYTISFFIGLIIASIIPIYRKTRLNWYLLLGGLIGLSLSLLSPAESALGLGYIFLTGFIAISAMFLPGISGAFIMLMMGSYSYMISVIHSVDVKPLLTFILGALAGAYFISRLMSYLLKKYKRNTFNVLLGLLIGALSVPISDLVQAGPHFTGDVISFFMIAAAGFFTVKVIEP